MPFDNKSLHCQREVSRGLGACSCSALDWFVVLFCNEGRTVQLAGK